LIKSSTRVLVGLVLIIDKENDMKKKWFSFKLMSSFLLLVVTTIWTMLYETSVDYDLWFCIWALCLVRFVDVLDEI
jgi:uncharacterized membrane protein